MIFIIRALSHVRKGWWRLWFPHKLGWDSGWKKKKKIKEATKKKRKKWEKKREGQCYYPLSTLVLQSSTMIFMIESLLWYHFHILVGIFHYITWLVYSNDGLPQNCPRSSWASELDAGPLSFFLSFHKLIALVHPLHGNPCSLTLISIDGHLHSPLIRLVDVRLSSPFLSSSQPPFYSTYSVMSMAHAHVLREDWKGLRTPKVWKNCLACHRGCAWFKYFVWWR